MLKIKVLKGEGGEGKWNRSNVIFDDLNEKA
jgi:hypothetical protein